MDKETLRMQLLSGVITEGQYKAKLNKIEAKEKKSLNEHIVGGGIVGIGAINQIPSRAKADYEDDFEHFLGQKYELKEEINEEEVEEGNLGHNEIASLEPEGRFWIVSWRGMEKVFTDEDEARAFMNTLEEGKEVEEPTNY